MAGNSEIKKGPSTHTKSYELKRFNTLVAYVHYKIYGGEVEGYETFDHGVKQDWVWIPVEMLSDIEREGLQAKVNAHLEYLKMEGRQWPDDAA